MVIQYHHGFTAFQQFRTFSNTGLIDVYHYKYGIAAYHVNRLCIADNHIFCIFIAIFKHFHHRLHGSRHIIQDNMSFLIEYLRNSVNTYGCTETVHVAHPVSHNIDFIFDGNNFLERMRLDSRFDTRTLLNLLALSSVIGNILRHLHNRLIAAAPKRYVYRITGKFIILRIT